MYKRDYHPDENIVFKTKNYGFDAPKSTPLEPLSNALVQIDAALKNENTERIERDTTLDEKINKEIEDRKAAVSEATPVNFAQPTNTITIVQQASYKHGNTLNVEIDFVSSSPLLPTENNYINIMTLPITPKVRTFLNVQTVETSAHALAYADTDGYLYIKVTDKIKMGVVITGSYYF